MIKQIKNEMCSLIFANAYNSDYRYFKQFILENEYENIKNLINNLQVHQYENLKQMIEIEIIVNTIQYCCELAAFAISVKDNSLNTQFLSHLATFNEDKIKSKFFTPIRTGNYELVSKFMGYYEIKIEENERDKYLLSYEKYKTDINKISEFYNKWYPLYTSYKHGLRLINGIDENTHKRMIIEACKDNSWNVILLPETWWKESSDINKIIHEIFTKLYVPLVKIKFDKYMDFSLESPYTYGYVEPIDTDSPNRVEISGRLTFDNSVWINEAKDQNPFY